MNAVSIGPLVFASDRLAAILGVFAFMITATILARRMDRAISAWASWALVAGLVAARLGHVGLHWHSFAGEPWRVFAIWQGGFEPLAGLAGVLLVSALMIRSSLAGLGAAAALGIGLFVWAGVGALTKATLGQPAPAVALQQLDGLPMAISDVAGKPAIVNIWASWCPPCRREMPLLAEVAASRTDVTFLFVNQGEEADKIRSYLARDRLSLNSILLDRSMQVARHYGVPGLPVTLFLRADGALASMHVGEISREALSAGIDRLAGAR
ncbi:peroxiredoxin [Camelimonas fluminis]|uniref:Prolipoprotein diacylglyceryl transferase family protein n=1 Tax=Camelimonas fluminis TaxID=1576911 RepID=A0ABV7UDC5_9HYPH|nr:TlpA disulfide reductase family protein [Camelimonas fluminis]GHE66188.1 peroxiredoxin [Camelimonas fluminis]